MCLTIGGGREIQPHKNEVHLQQENVYHKGQADPDNQLPDKWSSTVLNF